MCPWTKLRYFHLSDPLTPHHHRGAVPQTVGPEPQGTKVCPTFLNSWTRRPPATWGKQETHQSVLPATKALAKMTICTCSAINLNNFLYNNKSGTLCCCRLVDYRQAGGKRKLPIHKLYYLHQYHVDICSNNSLMFSDGLRLGPGGAHPQFCYSPPL